MFENFKAGWASRGKHPGVPPRLARKYQEAAVAILKRKVEIGMLTNAVATHERDIIPTAITVMNLPFVMGGVWADHTYGPKSKEYAAIVDGLIHCVQANYTGAPKVEFGAVILHGPERQCALEHFQSKDYGFKGSMDEMLHWSVPRGLAAAFLVRVRIQILSLLLQDAVSTREWTDAAAPTIAGEAGFFFATVSTSTVTPAKERAYGLFAVAALASFMGIQT